jgi:hypothetical protein
VTQGAGPKLTARELELLKIVRTATDEPNGFVPRVDHAHSKLQPYLYAMKAAGLVHFTELNPVVSITPAGRSALHQGAETP